MGEASSSDQKGLPVLQGLRQIFLRIHDFFTTKLGDGSIFSVLARCLVIERNFKTCLLSSLHLHKALLPWLATVGLEHGPEGCGTLEHATVFNT